MPDGFGRCERRVPGFVARGEGRIVYQGQTPMLTHVGLPGRTRREKRANAKAAQRAYVADKRSR